FRDSTSFDRNVVRIGFRLVQSRNPYRDASRGFYDVGKAGGETRVFPLVSMRSNYLSHAGTHTSACGTTAYLGEMGSSVTALNDSVFVCEPIGHLVTRSIIRSDGLRLVADRAESKRDFLASRDTWFRPASLATGPNGALYLADMYRMWVEHPKFLPEEIASKLDWRAGDDRGRIYRIVPVGESPSNYQPPTSNEEAVELLTSQNGWRQFTGQRLIVESQAAKTSQRLRQLLRHPSATTRLHAMWTLVGLDALQRQDVLTLLHDPSVPVRTDALRLAKSWISDATVFAGVCDAVAASDVRIRYAAALTLGDSETEEATRLLSRLALQDGADPMFLDGFLSSVGTRSGAVLARLISEESFRSKQDPGRAELVRRLSKVVGCRANMDEVREVIQLLEAPSSDAFWWEIPILDGLALGLQQHRGSRLSVQSLLSNTPQELTACIGRLEQSLTHYQTIATDRERSIEARRSSIALLAHQPFASAEPIYRELLALDQPGEIQAACLRSMVAARSSQATDVLLDHWPGLVPSVRGAATYEMLRRSDSTLKALRAMVSGVIDARVLSIDQRVRLLKHSNVEIRETATSVFGGAVSADRRQVASEYEAALKLECSSARGAIVFQRVCANCHRIDGQGQEIGPDLSDSANRSKLALLHDILDPNAKVEPRYLAQSVLTSDGIIYRGLIATETADTVVLSIAGGKQATVRRDEIESLKVDDVSLMPVGIEKEIDQRDMADLLEFLTNRPRSSE
ncbi:MAG: c-type cytochrome, partial [Planctomycetota bacterium]